MPIFYNQGAPTPTTKNTITSVATNYGVRDFLLNLNLLPQYPQISTSINGAPRIGEPFLDTMVNTGSNVVPIGLPLETNGILWKNMIIGINSFQNTSSTADNLTEITLVNTIPNADFPTTDWPQGIQSYPTSANQEVSQYGIVGKTSEANYRRKNTIKNLYLDVTKQIDMAEFIDLNPLDVSQQISGYLDTYGGLNLGGSGAIQAANVIGSVLNGQGLGLAKGGVVTNFDIRSSLAGRVLGATGLINDTKLGMIGGQQLVLALANNAGFNVQQELLGSLNVQNNILSLIKGDGWAGLRPSYKITIPSTTGGRILDTAGKILGFTIPRSYLDDAGSIFQSENGDSENIDRANEMLKYTGKGQAMALVKNFRASLDGTSNGGVDDPSKSPFRSGYAPAFTNNKGNYADNAISDPNLYAYSNGQGHFVHLLGSLEFGKSNGVIPSLCFERERKTEESGFESPEQLTFVGHRSNLGYDDRKVSDIAFSWGSDKAGLVNTDLDGNYSPITGNKKSLLVKTQALFNDKGMLNIVTRKGDMNKHSSQTQTANGYGFSKGNAVMKADMFDLTTGRWKGEKDKTAEETYCRSWTTLDRYDTVKKLVRSGTDGITNSVTGEFNGIGINENVPYRFQTQGSVLDAYGFPKIAPYVTDKPTDPKKFMFSIENLAWADQTKYLPASEKGPGDLLTGKKGRIMWFPPYDIQFSENSSVNWEANNFIGRGESIYTYNNTERSGNLSFKIVVDHPSYINAFRGSNGPDDHYVNSFWAGCIDPDSKWGERLTVSERSDIVSVEEVIKQEKVVPEECTPGDLTIYFPNDNTIIEPLYENGLITGTTTPIDYKVNPLGAGQGLGTYKADYTPGAHNNSKKKDGEGWPDRYNYGLNYSQAGPNGSEQTPLTVVGASNDVLRGYFDPNTDTYIVKHLTEICPHCVATITGYASEQGNITYNKKLARDRAIVIKEDIKKKWWPSIKAALPKLTDADFDKRFKIGETKQLTKTGCNPCPPNVTNATRDKFCPTDTLQCKKDRRATISFTFDKDLAAADIAQPDPIVKKTTKKIKNKIVDRYYNETKYFEQLTDEDPFIFDKFREKIRYFHPAFHSTTPEGLNSRLTFLLQCTRQGPTLQEEGTRNLAFGRPPVCILRIGDFYNTKIVIDSVGIDYEPLVWDLNPEGVGLQPMIANVSISFKFIGASSLMGPINKLQNALSFNYFANTQVYDPRADYISKEKPPVPPAPSPTTPVDDKSYYTSGKGTESEPYQLKEVVITAPKQWYLHTGQLDISTPEVTEISSETLNVEIDQEKANETTISPASNPQPAETSATTATTGTTITKEQFISCLGYDAMFYFNDNDEKLSLIMNFNKKVNVDRMSFVDPTNKGVQADVVVVLSNMETKSVGRITFKPNDNNSVVFKSIGSSLTLLDGEYDDEQILSIDTQTSKMTFKFDLSQINTSLDFIKTAANTSGSMIKIKFDNGSLINANFSNNTALKQ